VPVVAVACNGGSTTDGAGVGGRRSAGAGADGREPADDADAAAAAGDDDVAEDDADGVGGVEGDRTGSSGIVATAWLQMAATARCKIWPKFPSSLYPKEARAAARLLPARKWWCLFCDARVAAERTRARDCPS
jgi:hypothetical protein